MKTLSCTLAILIVVFSTTSVGQEPVKFHSLNVEQFCSSCGLTTAKIVVENLGYEKQVELIYNTDDWGWYSAPATYVKSIGDNKELWEVWTTGVIAYQQTQFAILYSVNGEDYWDNNGGEDYFVTPAGFTLADDVPLVLDEASWTFVTATQLYSFFGTINLRNLAPEKYVNIVYSMDDWETVEIAPAMYGSGDGGEYEVWTFSIDLPYGTPPQPIDFAIAYEVDGTIYWDNNFGSDYHVDP